MSEVRTCIQPTLHLVQALALGVHASGRTWSKSAGLMAALEVQVQSECSHLAALRVRVQRANQKCKCKECECEKIKKSDYSDVHIGHSPSVSDYYVTLPTRPEYHVCPE